jgi:hypothetical protein
MGFFDRLRESRLWLSLRAGLVLHRRTLFAFEHAVIATTAAVISGGFSIHLQIGFRSMNDTHFPFPPYFVIYI